MVVNNSPGTYSIYSVALSKLVERKNVTIVGLGKWFLWDSIQRVRTRAHWRICMPPLFVYALYIFIGEQNRYKREIKGRQGGKCEAN